jgi:SseB protein C-terminal domain/SseB protein N-terminal domain
MPFQPENLLEESLDKAASEPAHRPQFYQDFCAAEIFIVQHGTPPPTEHRALTPDTDIQIQQIQYNGKAYIPIFSSLTQLQLAFPQEPRYLSMNAMEFMKMTQGADLLLNPGSDCGKEFPAPEIAAILDGSIWQDKESSTEDIKNKVMLGQPQNYPHELAQALSAFFKTQKQVKRAWLAHFFNPADGQPPHTLVAIDATKGFDDIAVGASAAIHNVNMPDPPVDFMPITGNGKIEQHFLQDEKPFYTRRFFGLF